MSSFFWASGHLGWGVFSLVVFTVFWWLLTDLIWRSKNIKARLLLSIMGCGWIIGVGLILVCFQAFNT